MCWHIQADAMGSESQSGDPEISPAGVGARRESVCIEISLRALACGSSSERSSAELCATKSLAIHVELEQGLLAVRRGRHKFIVECKRELWIAFGCREPRKGTGALALSVLEVSEDSVRRIGVDKRVAQP